ncbi:MAG: hypothetical protein QOH63_1965 [Acidobacteriota bacterium]|jgi:DNA-binding CsgD family transcriptional regulator|nr:hypothetical protein [Acidobacteriota bacterium]
MSKMPVKKDIKVARARRLSAVFQWTPKKKEVALALAQGKTQQEIRRETGVAERTIRDYLAADEFSAEVDTLSNMIGISSRAERLRIAMRVVRQMTKTKIAITEKDLLDWLKYAQSETDGVKLDLAKFAEALNIRE